MQELPIESSYPLTFRSKEAAELGQHLKHQHSVVLIGMKRVGISNFLRFFLYHPDIAKTCIADGKNQFFSPIFSYYLEHLRNSIDGKQLVEFTKKEHMLFNFLQNCKEEICEREKIVQEVWPEVEAFGVSDWAIDRLIARVRGKLKLSNSKFAIKTVKTRGYKLELTE